MPVPTGTAAGPLAVAADLSEYGTFSDDAVEAAGESIRSETGWHIAPTATETLVLDSEGGYALMLPTLHLIEVTEVRDVSGDTPAIITGWRKSVAGMLILPYGRWAVGAETIEVDIEHGYETCPLELLPVLARRIRDNAATSAGQVRLGSLSIGTTSVGTTVTAQDEAVIARYSL